MNILVGYFKGEAFVIGHTSSRAKAEKWIEAYPNGLNDEYDYIERHTSHTL